MKLYKYRSGNDNDLKALFKHGIWVPFVNQLNDFQDISIYCKNLTDDQYDEYQNFIYNSGFACGCLSFSTLCDNKLLWHFYADNFKGFVLEYESDEIEKVLKEKGICSAKDFVEYLDVKKQDCSDAFVAYCEGKRFEKFIDWHILFSKDKFWSYENEYRFSVPSDFFDKYCKDMELGALLIGILPTKIVLGNFIDEKKEVLLKQFASQNKISLSKMTINYDSIIYSLREKLIL